MSFGRSGIHAALCRGNKIIAYGSGKQKSFRGK
jgi:hypothetical protein